MSKFIAGLVPLVLAAFSAMPAWGQWEDARGWDDPMPASSGSGAHQSSWGKGITAARGPDRLPRAVEDSIFDPERIAPRPPVPASGATISAQTLQHPPSKKEVKVLRQAELFALSGDHAKAIEVLRAATRGAAGSSYLRSRLGTEYLKSARPDLAVPELEAAVHLAPGESAHHANLAYAYRLTLQLTEAEREARAALELDRATPQAHFLLGVILIARRGNLNEAVENLKLARRDIRSARLALAQVYAMTGSVEASRKELAGYLAVATDAERALVGQAFPPAMPSCASGPPEACTVH